MSKSNKRLNWRRFIVREQNATLVEYSLIYEDNFVVVGRKPTKVTGLYIWVVQPTNKITFRKVDLRSLNTSLEDLVACARLEIGVEPRGGIGVQPRSKCQSQPEQLKGLHQLYQLLIEPIADLLLPNEQDKIIFIPHQQLFLVPFQALQDANHKYLIEKHTILVAPSIQSLSITHQRKKDIQNRGLTGDVLLVGNPTMPKIEVGDSLEQLPPLKGAENEVKAIAEQLGTIKTLNVTSPS